MSFFAALANKIQSYKIGSFIETDSMLNGRSDCSFAQTQIIYDETHTGTIPTKTEAKTYL